MENKFETPSMNGTPTDSIASYSPVPPSSTVVPAISSPFPLPDATTPLSPAPVSAPIALPSVINATFPSPSPVPEVVATSTIPPSYMYGKLAYTDSPDPSKKQVRWSGIWSEQQAAVDGTDPTALTSDFRYEFFIPAKSALHRGYVVIDVIPSTHEAEPVCVPFSGAYQYKTGKDPATGTWLENTMQEGKINSKGIPYQWVCRITFGGEVDPLAYRPNDVNNRDLIGLKVEGRNGFGEFKMYGCYSPSTGEVWACKLYSPRGTSTPKAKSEVKPKTRRQGDLEDGLSHPPAVVDTCPKTEVVFDSNIHIAPEIKSMADVFLSIRNNRHRPAVFVKPVTDDIVPGYSSVISQPMCLDEVQRRLSTGRYIDTEGFLHDMNLIFDNAMRFNPVGHPIHSDALYYKKVLKDSYDKAIRAIEKEQILKQQKIQAELSKKNKLEQDRSNEEKRRMMEEKKRREEEARRREGNLYGGSRLVDEDDGSSYGSSIKSRKSVSRPKSTNQMPMMPMMGGQMDPNLFSQMMLNFTEMMKQFSPMNMGMTMPMNPMMMGMNPQMMSGMVFPTAAPVSMDEPVKKTPAPKAAPKRSYSKTDFDYDIDDDEDDDDYEKKSTKKKSRSSTATKKRTSTASTGGSRSSVTNSTGLTSSLPLATFPPVQAAAPAPVLTYAEWLQQPLSYDEQKKLADDASRLSDDGILKVMNLLQELGVASDTGEMEFDIDSLPTGICRQMQRLIAEILNEPSPGPTPPAGATASNSVSTSGFDQQAFLAEGAAEMTGTLDVPPL